MSEYLFYKEGLKVKIMISCSVFLLWYCAVITCCHDKWFCDCEQQTDHCAFVYTALWDYYVITSRFFYTHHSQKPSTFLTHMLTHTQNGVVFVQNDTKDTVIKKIHPALLMVRSRNIIMIDRVCNRAHVKSCSRPDWYVECHKHPWTFTYESVSQTMTLFPFALLLCSHSTLNHTNDEKSHNAMFF